MAGPALPWNKFATGLPDSLIFWCHILSTSYMWNSRLVPYVIFTAILSIWMLLFPAVMQAESTLPTAKLDSIEEFNESTYTVRVLDPSGNPIPDANVELFTTPLCSQISAVSKLTLQDGTAVFIIPDTELTSYTSMKISKSGYQDNCNVTLAYIPIPQGDTEYEVRLSLVEPEPMRIIYFTVSGDLGNGQTEYIGGASLRFSHTRDPSIFWTGVTNAGGGGTISIPLDPAAVNQVQIRADGYFSKTIPFSFLPAFVAFPALTPISSNNALTIEVLGRRNDGTVGRLSTAKVFAWSSYARQDIYGSTVSPDNIHLISFPADESANIIKAEAPGYITQYKQVPAGANQLSISLPIESDLNSASLMIHTRKENGAYSNPIDDVQIKLSPPNAVAPIKGRSAAGGFLELNGVFQNPPPYQIEAVKDGFLPYQLELDQEGIPYLEMELTADGCLPNVVYQGFTDANQVAGLCASHRDFFWAITIARLAFEEIWNPADRGIGRRRARKDAWRNNPLIATYFGTDNLTNRQIRLTKERIDFIYEQGVSRRLYILNGGDCCNVAEIFSDDATACALPTLPDNFGELTNDLFRPLENDIAVCELDVLNGINSSQMLTFSGLIAHELMHKLMKVVCSDHHNIDSNQAQVISHVQSAPKVARKNPLVYEYYIRAIITEFAEEEEMP